MSLTKLVQAIVIIVLSFIITEFNQYSHCREWRLELTLREQGVVPARSWGAAAIDFVAGDLITVGRKWQCGIEINRGEAATLAPALGSAIAWTLRTVGRGLAEIGAAVREISVLRGAAGFVRSPTALLGRITARRLPMLVLGGALLALYFGSSQLLLDALALLPWVIQWAVWALLFFCMFRFIWSSVQATAGLRVPLRALWSRWIRPRLAARA